MLKHLSVKNYALIDHLDLDLNQGFTAVTGETGAGKSIILGALGLILGNRADLKALRDPQRKCVIEGTFELSDGFQLFFEEHDLDFEKQSIIRREITPSGKSRAFINDTPVKLTQLNGLAMHLIDVHSQHQNLLLNDRAFQLELLDGFAKNASALSRYQKEYTAYQKLQKEQKRLEQLAQSELGDADYLQFLFDELENAKLVPGEQEELEQDLERIENSGAIEAALRQALTMADGDDASVSFLLKRMQGALSGIQDYDPELGPLVERLESITIELDDIRLELEGKTQQTEFDPAEQERMDERLSQLIALQKKHQVASLEELINKKDTLEARIADITEVERGLSEIKKKQDQQLGQLEKAATQLTQSRLEVLPGLETEIQKLLAQLNMPHAIIQIEIHAGQQYSSTGRDIVTFMFTANKGSSPEPLHKIASGGEMSRVMLAIKAIMAQSKSLPTIIFDEIDTGVSGETAGKIGEILAAMGQHLQVLSITHLPQIAALGAHHLKVYKQVNEQNTYTHLKPLSNKERVEELARLLSGNKITDAALKNAENLLNQSA